MRFRLARKLSESVAKIEAIYDPCKREADFLVMQETTHDFVLAVTYTVHVVEPQTVSIGKRFGIT